MNAILETLKILEEVKIQIVRSVIYQTWRQRTPDQILTNNVEETSKNYLSSLLKKQLRGTTKSNSKHSPLQRRVDFQVECGQV